MNTASFSEFLDHLGAASLQAAVLAACIWVASRILGGNLAPQWRCSLWCLVIIRLAWPFSVSSPISVLNVLTVPHRLSRTDWLSFHLPDTLADTVEGWLQEPWVVVTWLGIAGVLLLRMLCGWLFSVHLRRNSAPATLETLVTLLQECKARANVKTSIELLLSEKVSGPCLVGILRPRLLLPPALAARLTTEELRLIFLHELAHLQRRDLAISFVLAVVEAVHWFNPLVWVVSREVRAAREEACDARALASNPELRRAYGEMVLKLTNGSPDEDEWAPLPEAAFLGSSRRDFSDLTHRIRAIADFQPNSRTWVVGLCTWLAIACVGLTDAEPFIQSEAPEIGTNEAAPTPAHTRTSAMGDAG
jgi:bla regulator protein BlaR1